jgi:hypothetical protein
MINRLMEKGATLT